MGGGGQTHYRPYLALMFDVDPDLDKKYMDKLWPKILIRVSIGKMGWDIVLLLYDLLTGTLTLKMFKHSF